MGKCWVFIPPIPIKPFPFPFPWSKLSSFHSNGNPMGPMEPMGLMGLISSRDVLCFTTVFWHPDSDLPDGCTTHRQKYMISLVTEHKTFFILLNHQHSRIARLCWNVVDCCSRGPGGREIIRIHCRSNPKWQTCLKLYVAHSSAYWFSGAKRGRVWGGN